MNRYTLSKLFFLLLLSLILNSGSVGISLAEEPEIMTLPEAASFLRVLPEEIEIMAQEKSLPARLIGKEWRFSKAALLHWLAGNDANNPDSVNCCAHRNDPPSVLHEKEQLHSLFNTERLSPYASAQFAGRGTVAAGNESPGVGGSRSQQIGTGPGYDTAESIFLRNENVLLKAKEMSLEMSLFYALSEKQVFALLSNSSSAEIKMERESLVTSLGVRYGLSDNLQIFGRLPYVVRKDSFTALGERTRDTEGNIKEFSLGINSSIVQENIGYPGIILNAEGLIPVSKGSYSAAAGIAAIRTIDPAILFGSLNYRHTWSRHFNDLGLLVPRETFSVNLGYAYALNNTLSIGTVFSSIFSGKTRFDKDITLQSKKQFSIKLSLTSLVNKNTYLEPALTFGLNRETSDIIFGTNLVYTFGD